MKSLSDQRSPPIRILIVDDHTMVRAGLRAMLERQARICVAGEAGDHASALVIAANLQPDIILLDLDLGAESGFDLLPQLLTAAPEARVIALTGLRDPAEHRRAVLLGAMGLVLKEKAIETVIMAIEKVHAGEVWLDRSMIASILNNRAHPNGAQAKNLVEAQLAMLTDREREVVQLIGEGLRNKEIAQRLVISEATVRNHLTSIFAKLGLADRFELVVYAYRYGLAKLPE